MRLSGIIPTVLKPSGKFSNNQDMKKAIQKTLKEYRELTASFPAKAEKLSERTKTFRVPMQPPYQGGRTWQPFVGGKNGHENIRQARIYNYSTNTISCTHLDIVHSSQYV